MGDQVGLVMEVVMVKVAQGEKGMGALQHAHQVFVTICT